MLLANFEESNGPGANRRRPGRSGQTWKIFLRNHAAGIGAMDFLIVPTVNFRLLSVLVILRHERRRLISLSVTDHPTAEWIAQVTMELNDLDSTKLPWRGHSAGRRLNCWSWRPNGHNLPSMS